MTNTKQTREELESEIRSYQVFQYLLSLVIVFLMLFLVIVWNNHDYKKLQNENSVLREGCGLEVPICESQYTRFETNHIQFIGEDCKVRVNGEICQFEDCEVLP